MSAPDLTPHLRPAPRPRTPPREPAVQPFHVWDLVLVFGLTAIALVGWESTFRGPGWWVAGGLAALTGILVAVTVVSARGGVEIVTLVLLIGYYLASGPIVDGTLRLDGLRTLESGVRANAEGWPILLGTHPPIDGSGAVLIAPVLLSLTSAGVGAALALRSTRAALPLVPPTLMLGAVLLLAQPEPVSVLLQGVGYGTLAMWWMRLRGLRVDEAAHGPDPARAWRLVGSVALVVVVALVAGLLASTSQPDERLLLSRRLAPYQVEKLSTPLDEFRHYTRQRGRKEGNVFNAKLFEVEGAPTGARLRLAALDTYDGSSWQADNDTDPEREDDRFLRLSTTIENPSSGKERRVTVRPTANYTMPWVPTLGAVRAFQFLGSAREDAQSHLRYNPATQTAVMDDGLEKSDAYLFATGVTGGPLKQWMSPSEQLDPELYDQAAFLQPAVDAWAVGTTYPMQALFQVAARLKKVGRYSSGFASWEAIYRPGHAKERLGDDFVLGVPTVGDDEQYAAAMALLATRLGVPARVVVGAVVPRSGTVRGKDIQAWVEVRIEDGSWRTLPTEAFMGHKPPERSEVGRPKLRSFPPLQPQSPEAQEPEAEEPQAEEQEEDLSPDAGAGSGGVPWRWMVLLVIVLLLSAVPLAKVVRRRRRLAARRVSARYAGAWLELVDRARDLGHPVPAGLTRPAEARVVGGATGDGSLLTLAAEADSRIFGADEPPAADAAAFWALVRDHRSGLAAGVSLRRRIWALFSPSSLRPPPGDAEGR
ncbi:transglutaminase domain-containing protein [Nocardioides sp. cx-173]|uniref:transglutaminase domain-containing protein n=1 Tax=Nocardioides sp. cx-173 TaxID=2898796 RepID=UPI001E41775E|nr:transglutaminase domain-containing protein [Nocardioides sp. cx-173]MCD4523700.1 transglutaminaseTgpA domain-containing protein [Nocardioides sp. cx-173]UGB41970.1 transglutaminaseTgpA domain-containing protein [Nocardioides sp. cx-173]